MLNWFLLNKYLSNYFSIMSTPEFRIGTTIDILFNEGETTKPYEGVIIKILYNFLINSIYSELSFGSNLRGYLSIKIIQL